MNMLPSKKNETAKYVLNKTKQIESIRIIIRRMTKKDETFKKQKNP